MREPDPHRPGQVLKTPGAAAVAGIIFAVLMITSYVLLFIAVPLDPFASMEQFQSQLDLVSLSLGLVPFAGIAFLWVMGVIRDRLGQFEDQFFATLYLGSGLLYLAMTFAAAATAGGLLLVYGHDPGMVLNSDAHYFIRAITYKFSNVFAIRMAGMHMLVLGTIWFHTRTMPRWMAFVTYALALVLIVGIGYWPWVTLAFPAWVLVTSLYILFLDRHGQGVLEEVDISADRISKTS
ncbi:MAG: hypothetical protein U9R25_08535 [Chloroflexota bacterium]|nr:hypothetical protein [Chloroflexota bacterium]